MNCSLDKSSSHDSPPPPPPKIDDSPPDSASMEAAEKQISEAGAVTFRKMKRTISIQSSQNQDQNPRKKRGWGDSKKTKIDATIKSSELKDIIPDIKPILEEIKHEEEHKKLETDNDASKEQPTDLEVCLGEVHVDEPMTSVDNKTDTTEKALKNTADLPKPLVEDPAKVHEKLAPISEKNKNQSRVVEVRNLVRPFTNNQLIGFLKRTGNFDESTDFWIDKIKSHALVKFKTAAEAEETVMALDGVKWPSSNQKKLIVTFSSDEHFKRQSKEAVSLPDAASAGSGRGDLKRSASSRDAENSGESRKRSRRDSLHDEKDQRKKSSEGRGGRTAEAAASVEAEEAKKETKSLEVLFKKTKALPSIYWMPKAESSSSSSS